MADLLSELEAVVGLDQRATPGKVELHTSCSWRRIMAERGRGFLVPGIDPDRHPNMDSIENAEFVVALVNWFRTHHAEIAAAVRDAGRLEVVEDRLLTLVNAIKRAGCDPLKWSNWTPEEREAISAAMRAGEGEG